MVLYLFRLIIIVEVPNRAQRKMSSILSWENTKMATIEAEIKKNEVNGLLNECLHLFNRKETRKKASMSF